MYARNSTRSFSGDSSEECAGNSRDPGDIGFSSPGWEGDPWRRKWQQTLVFLLGKSHGQRT